MLQAAGSVGTPGPPLCKACTPLELILHHSWFSYSSSIPLLASKNYIHHSIHSITLKILKWNGGKHRVQEAHLHHGSVCRAFVSLGKAPYVCMK
jgi:hypothetical protein